MSNQFRTAAKWAALALIGATAACASAEPPAQGADAGRQPRQCFWARDVNGFTAVDDTHVNLRVGVNDIYELELMAPCHDIDWAQKIAIQSRGSSWICSGLDAVLIAPSSIGPHRCHVKSIRKLTAEEIKALPGKARP